MKKLLIALVLGALLVLGLTTIALADNGPHGSFTATTDACANCHRVHTAQYGSNSLLIMDPEALCLSCHDGVGAGTDVEHGVYSQAGSDAFTGVAGSAIEGTDGASLFGGGFLNATMAHTWNGAATGGAAATSDAVTSKHDIGVPGTIWGSGAANSTAVPYTLECTSCHDPHGNAGYSNTTTTTSTWCNTIDYPTEACSRKSASYRLLRWQPQGSSGFTSPGTVNWSSGAYPGNGATTAAGTQGWTVPDNFATNGTEWYTIGTTGAFAIGDYQAGGNASNTYNLKNVAAPEAKTYVDAAVHVAYFCAQCHDRYFAKSTLRNNTDRSLYCGSPAVGGETYNGVVLAEQLAVAGEHPVDPIRCEPVYTGAVITAWGDNGDTGDLTYTYMHSSGDVIRSSTDGTGGRSALATLSLGRSCVACHVSHGTAALMTTANALDDITADSALLRMDNRSQCLRCHAGNINFVIAP